MSVPAKPARLERLTREVSRYIIDCKRHRRILDPQYHPTADGAVKLIYHRGTGDRKYIKDEFARIMGT